MMLMNYIEHKGTIVTIWMGTSKGILVETNEIKYTLTNTMHYTFLQFSILVNHPCYYHICELIQTLPFVT